MGGRNRAKQPAGMVRNTQPSETHGLSGRYIVTGTAGERLQILWAYTTLRSAGWQTGLDTRNKT